MKRLSSLMVQTFDKCQRDNTPMLAAALSFYAMLSMAPALWIVMAAAGAVIGRESAHNAVMAWMARNVGSNASEYLATVVAQVNESGRLATIGGVLAMFLGATAAFSALQESLNQIWHQPASPSLGFLVAAKGFARGFFIRQLLAFLIMLLIGALLLASLLASSSLSFLARYVPAILPAPQLLLEIADFIISMLLTTLLFGTIFHMLHRKAFGKRGLWVGAAVTAVLFTIGKMLIAMYLGGAGMRSAYGAAGSFVLLILWIYYSAQILLFGAEFTEVYSRPGTPARP